MAEKFIKHTGLVVPLDAPMSIPMQSSRNSFCRK